MKKITKTVKGWGKEGYKTAKNNAEQQINAWNSVAENYENFDHIPDITKFTLKHLRPEAYVPASVFELDMGPEHIAELKCDTIMDYLKSKTKHGTILSENTTQYLIIAYRNKVIMDPYRVEEALPALVTTVSIYDVDVTLEYLLEKFVNENQGDFYYIENGETHYCSSVIDVIPLDGSPTTSYQISESDMENVIQSISTRLQYIYSIADAAQSTREQLDGCKRHETKKQHKSKKAKDKKVTVGDMIDVQFSPKKDADLNTLAKYIMNTVFGQGALDISVNPSKGHDQKKKKNKKKNEKPSDLDTHQSDTEDLKPINTKINNDEKSTETNKEN